MIEKWKYQYWLSCIKGVGNKKRKKLVEYCGSAKEVYALTKKQLMSIPKINEKEAEAVVFSRLNLDLEKEADILNQTGIKMLTIEEAEFPKRLLQLSDCPYAIFYKGNIPSEQERTAAIVGARMCSSYGKAAGLALGEALAAQGISIVSGMAYGIDSFGHWGAVKGGGRTYAVLGCGVDVCYPKGGWELYEKIQSCGGLLSEYLPGTKPVPGQFPARNRLISALSDIVILVEAKQKSGSLITADFALEQGKDIYAVPGRMDDALSMGCNELIRQGAGIITNIEGFLLELGFGKDEIKQKKEKEREKIEKALEKDELMVYSCFSLAPKNMEELVKMTKMPVQKLANILISLQAKGLIEEYYKNHYHKK